MALTPNLFISQPRIEGQIITAAGSRDGTTGTFFKLFAANPVTGSRLESVYVMNSSINGISVPNNNNVRLYLADANGNNMLLFRDYGYPGIQPSTTFIGSQNIFNFPGGLYLGTNSSIYVAIQTYSTGTFGKDGIHVVATGGDL